jgi:hypothetical protein
MATPANSPWAPAIGLKATPSMPETAFSISCSSYRHASTPCPLHSGASGCRARSSGSIAYWLQAFGLYFIVHEPSG